MSEEQRVELLPCPFCTDGGEPYLCDAQFGTRAHEVAVRCRQCGARAAEFGWASGLTNYQDQRFNEAKIKAIAAWNNRPATTTTALTAAEQLRNEGNK